MLARLFDSIKVIPYMAPISARNVNIWNQLMGSYANVDGANSTVAGRARLSRIVTW